MSPRPPRQGPEKRDTRSRILEAALKVFSEKGFQGATNADIAREAGVTPGLIYWYFHSKQALFQAVFQHHTYVMPVAQWIQDHTNDPPETFLREFADRFLSMFESEAVIRVVRLVFAESMRTSWLGPVVSAEVYRRVVQALAQYLQRQAQHGRLRSSEDWEVVAQGFLGSLISFALFGRVIPLEGAAHPREKVAATLASAFLDGLR